MEEVWELGEVLAMGMKPAGNGSLMGGVGQVVRPRPRPWQLPRIPPLAGTRVCVAGRPLAIELHLAEGGNFKVNNEDWMASMRADRGWQPPVSPLGRLTQQN